MKKRIAIAAVAVLIACICCGCKMSAGDEIYSQARAGGDFSTVSSRAESGYEPTTVTDMPPELMGDVMFYTEEKESKGRTYYYPTRNTDRLDALSVISYLRDVYGEPYSYDNTYVWANDDETFKIVLSYWEDDTNKGRGMLVFVNH